MARRRIRKPWWRRVPAAKAAAIHPLWIPMAFVAGASSMLELNAALLDPVWRWSVATSLVLAFIALAAHSLYFLLDRT